jgi:hypothetical protein
LLEYFDALVSNRKFQGSKIIPQSENESENLPLEISKLRTGKDGSISGALWVVGKRGIKELAFRLCKQFRSLIIHLKVFHVQLMKNKMF